jgi:hypothetical protein
MDNVQTKYHDNTTAPLSEKRWNNILIVGLCAGLVQEFLARPRQTLSIAPSLSTFENKYCALVYTMLQYGFMLEFNHNVATDHVNV